MFSFDRNLVITSAAVTDVGHRRERNEDAVLAVPERGIFCVADGMGGAVGGHEASQQIVACLQAASEALDVGQGGGAVDAVAAAIRLANERIHARARELHAAGMGSTVVALTLADKPGAARILHAGDSRAYLCRKGALSRLTKDHTIAAEIGLGDEERVPSFIDGMLTRAVGLNEQIILETSDLKLRDGDAILLCTDGLNKHLKDDELAEFLRCFPEDDVQAIANRLIIETKSRGAIDNVSVVVIGVRKALA